jgi:hypothetical protein
MNLRLSHIRCVIERRSCHRPGEEVVEHGEEEGDEEEGSEEEVTNV